MKGRLYIESNPSDANEIKRMLTQVEGDVELFQELYHARYNFYPYLLTESEFRSLPLEIQCQYIEVSTPYYIN